jgi:LacI family transcriptional regulator/LacI family purine nucleotide synthesis repressor
MSKNKSKVSLQQIADHVGVSKYAVSLALNDKPGVSDETRKRIVSAAYDLGYHKTVNTCNEKAKNVLIMIPEYISNDAYFYSTLYWSLETELKQHNYNAILTSITLNMQNRLNLPDFLSLADISGILTVGVFHNEYIKKVLSTGLPVISVDHYYDMIPMDSIVTANIESAYQMTNHLISMGHKDIGYIGAIKMSASLFERWCGYYKALLHSDIHYNHGFSILTSETIDTLHKLGELKERLTDMPSLPTAFFCGGDRIAFDLIHTLNQMNKKVPDDISVVGFDDLETSKVIIPALTTIRVDRELMGKRAVEFLLQRIQQGKSTDYKEKIALNGEIVVRDSVKPIST